MRIIKPSRLREAYEGHSEWKASLLAWKKVVEQANWNNSNDVKQTFANFTTVGKYSRFEISHNRCRLMAEINYRTHLVFIRAIVTHKEYDLRNWEEE